jgi:hypothetical protein
MPFDGIDQRRIGVLDKMDRVIELLSRERRWCKRHLRTADGRRCILGALADADAQSLQGQVLLAIGEVTGRSYRRIESFNDDPLTTHAQVMRVLLRARENIVNGIVAPATVRAHAAVTAAPPPTHGLGRMRQLLASFGYPSRRII